MGLGYKCHYYVMSTMRTYNTLDYYIQEERNTPVRKIIMILRRIKGFIRGVVLPVIIFLNKYKSARVEYAM